MTRNVTFLVTIKTTVFNVVRYPVLLFGLICCILTQYFGSSVVVFNTNIIKYTKPIHISPNVYRFKKQINISQVDTATCQGKKLLVYTCNERCGGWGDRQKGIVSAFLLALLSNRTFVIDLQVPCDVNNFIDPNMYDWTKCREYVNTIPENDTETVFIGKIASLIAPLKQENYTDSWNKTVIIVKISAYERIMNALRKNPIADKQIPWLKEYTNIEILNLMLRYLLVPKITLHQHLKSYINVSTQGRKKLVCGHIRIGINPSNPLDDSLGDEYFTRPRQNAVFTTLKQYSDPSKYVVYLATDSDEVRNHAKSILPNYINLDRKIVHVDKHSYVNSTESCNGLYTVLFEQYLLTKCDYLVLTRSNFGANAAYIRGHSKGLFLYYQGRVEPATLADIQKIYIFK
ncbi:hypothetical protein ACF0H5_013492 [Mactra antiquata]